MINSAISSSATVERLSSYTGMVLIMKPASERKRKEMQAITFKPCSVLILKFPLSWLTAEDYKPPDELMQVKLPLVDRETCNQPDWNNNTVDDSMVCAGYEEGERGNCFVSATYVTYRLFWCKQFVFYVAV